MVRGRNQPLVPEHCHSACFCAEGPPCGTHTSERDESRVEEPRWAVEARPTREFLVSLRHRFLWSCDFQRSTDFIEGNARVPESQWLWGRTTCSNTGQIANNGVRSRVWTGFDSAVSGSMPGNAGYLSLTKLCALWSSDETRKVKLFSAGMSHLVLNFWTVTFPPSVKDNVWRQGKDSSRASKISLSLAVIDSVSSCMQDCWRAS
ncbi:hypothetical protein FB451DRAFT_274616 [Mycena latifolia]|nr:hypothetical protein FB451DRAFT_274616 [Mycena latifolia]